MCGIYGIIRGAAAPEVHRLELMGETLGHRGPDDRGVEIIGRAGLGHRRLSIIDVVGGRQPLGNEDGSVRVIFNEVRIVRNSA